MGFPGQPLKGGAGNGPGHGPFGDRAFKMALYGCVVCVALGALAQLAGGAVDDAGLAMLVLGGLGLLIGGGGLLAERAVLRRAAERSGPPPPPAPRGASHREPDGGGNGRVPHVRR